MELQRLVFSFFNAEVAARYWPDILYGMWVTAYLGAAVIAAGLAAGLGLAMLRSFHFRPASLAIVVFADAFRALPPLVGSSSRLQQRSSVDLPEPEGPMMKTSSPCATARSIPFSTSAVPKDL